MNAPILMLGAMGLALACFITGFSSALADFADSWQAGDSREQRGLNLLKQWLSSEQLASFEQTKSFCVVGSDSGKLYRITYGNAQNVYELDSEGRMVSGLCFVPEGYLVAGDVMLSQKISLETNETEAIAVARRFSPRAGSHAGALLFR